MYQWDNVYTYDKEFRIHMSHYPQRNWSIILQQAWSMYLNDKISNRDRNSDSPSTGKIKEICDRYNWGKCQNGYSCKYKHCCKICKKLGHGVHICRKRKNASNPGASNIQKNPAVSHPNVNNGNAGGTVMHSGPPQVNRPK